jgi:YHS domain-containing protein
VAKTLDPVCKMDLDTASVEFQSACAGNTVYFCSEDCKDEFEDRPQDFAAAAAA